MKIFTLYKAENKIKSRFSKRYNSSISAIFRDLRNDPRFSPYGDYILFSLIVNTLTNMRIPIKKSTLRYALKQSEEFKGKSLILKELLTPQRMPKFSSQITQDRLLKNSRYKLPENGGNAK